jgi:hypothetical protein
MYRNCLGFDEIKRVGRYATDGSFLFSVYYINDNLAGVELSGNNFITEPTPMFGEENSLGFAARGVTKGGRHIDKTIEDKTWVKRN